MPVLRYLNVQLRLAADDFNNKIKAASKEAKEFEKTIRPSQELLKQIGTTMTAAGVVVVGSLTAMAKSAANYGDKLLEASKRTGATVQELAKLKFAAEQNGASFEDLAAGMRILARNADDASKGAKTQSATFKELGIAVTDSSGKLRPMNQLLLDAADKFAQRVFRGRHRHPFRCGDVFIDGCGLATIGRNGNDRSQRNSPSVIWCWR